MRPFARSAALRLATISALALALAACGGGAHHRRTLAGHHDRRAVARVLSVYSSLPLTGPVAAEGGSIARGIRLALHQAGYRAGPYVVRYHSLSDSTVGHGPWDAEQTAANARRVLTDPSAVAYIGEFDSAATEVSLPMLNQAGIPQITPWSPYVGLTQTVPGTTAVGEPLRYYPTRVRTLLRIAPDDAVQAGAMLLALHDQDCSRLAILRSGQDQSSAQELADLLFAQRLRYGIRVVSSAALPATGSPLRRYLVGLRELATGCVAYAGLSPSSSAAAGLAEVHLNLPHARLIASDELCGAIIDQPAVRSRLAALRGSLECTYPAVASSSPGYGGWLAAWRGMYGHSRPDVWAAYGYGAMRLVLQELRALGPQAEDRARLLRALFSAHLRTAALGGVGFEQSGDASSRTYGLYELGAMARPLLLRVLQPAPAAPDLS